MTSKCGLRHDTPPGPWPAAPAGWPTPPASPMVGASQEKGDLPKRGSSHLLPGVSLPVVLPVVPCGPRSLGLQLGILLHVRTRTRLPSLSGSPLSCLSLPCGPRPPSFFLDVELLPRQDGGDRSGLRFPGLAGPHVVFCSHTYVLTYLIPTPPSVGRTLMPPLYR